MKVLGKYLGMKANIVDPCAGKRQSEIEGKRIVLGEHVSKELRDDECGKMSLRGITDVVCVHVCVQIS